MLLIKSKKYTPGSRHKIFLKKIFLIKKKKIFSYSSYTQKMYLRRRIFFFKNQHIKTINLKPTKIPFIFLNYFVKAHKNKEFGSYINIFGVKFMSIVSNMSYPGLKHYSLNYILQNNFSKKIVGQVVPLYLIPINFLICNVQNTLNIKNSYAKSLGSFSVRLKKLKKQKIILVKLPSNKTKLFPINTLVCLGVINSHFKEKCVQGKWGVSTNLYKKITVRGVAKNPVDHPNGGRTKAKQPELSPWGWIAKLNK